MANFYKKPFIYLPTKKQSNGGGAAPNAGDLLHTLGYITNANNWANGVSNAFSELHAKGILQTGAPQITSLVAKLAVGYTNSNYNFNAVRGKAYFYSPLYYLVRTGSSSKFNDYNIELPHVYFVDNTTHVCYKLTTSSTHPRIMTYTSAHTNNVSTTPSYSDIGDKVGQHNVFGFPYNQNNTVSSRIDTALTNEGVTHNGWLVMSTDVITDSDLTSDYGATSFVDVTY